MLTGSCGLRHSSLVLLDLTDKLTLMDSRQHSSSQRQVYIYLTVIDDLMATLVISDFGNNHQYIYKLFSL